MTLTLSKSTTSSSFDKSPSSGRATRRESGGMMRKLASYADSVLNYRVFWTTIMPLIFLVGGTLLIEVANLDLKVSGLFFDSTINRFPLKNAEPWFTLSNWGCYPGLILGGAGIAMFVIGCIVPKLRSLVRPGLILGGIVLIGPGMLVNVVVKDIWGRPRPEQTSVFGGDMQYRRLYQPGATDLEAHSFPCGHASIGFYLMAPAFLFWQSRPRWSAAFLALGLGMGLFIGYCRMIQGSHFLSDVLWSAGIVYFTGLLFHYCFGAKTPTWSDAAAGYKTRAMSRVERRASIDFAIGKIQSPLLVPRGELAALRRAV